MQDDFDLDCLGLRRTVLPCPQRTTARILSARRLPPLKVPGLTILTWLAHRAAEALSDAFNGVSREAGLADLRDWLVLALVSDGVPRTRLEIATELGIDKSNLWCHCLTGWNGTG